MAGNEPRPAHVPPLPLRSAQNTQYPDSSQFLQGVGRGMVAGVVAHWLLTRKKERR